MKSLLIVVLWLVCGCVGDDDFHCQSYDGKSQYFQYFCKHIDEMRPENCSKTRFLVESLHVSRLQIQGCDLDSVAYAMAACSNVHILDISRSGYESLDSFDLKHPELKTFNASHNQLQSIKMNFFGRAPSLIECDFSHNKLEMVRPFTGVDELRRLHLSHNNISSIDDDAFSQLTWLEYVDLSHNKLNRIRASVYWNLIHLKKLHLEANPIDTLNCENLLKTKTVAVYITWNAVEFLSTDCEAAQLRIVSSSPREGFFPARNGNYELHCNQRSFTNLISFTAGHNQIENVADVIPCLGSAVVGLYLDGNFIGAFNSNKFRFEQFINLKELSLRDTELTAFDFALLAKQTLLRTLDISNNSLKRVDNIGTSHALDNLIEFAAAQNCFENVSEIIENLTPSIKTLDLSSNFIGTINGSVFQRLRGLEVLHLRNTSLQIPDFSAFEQLESLETLDISFNDLSKTNFTSLLLPVRFSAVPINYTQTPRHEHLRTLNLSHTNLPVSDLKSFERLRSLETLDISHNHLRTMQFTKLFIKILDLSGNQLGEINANTFGELKNLVGLKLSRTNLSISNTNPFESLRRLAVLDISNNNLETVDFTILSPTLNKLFGFQAINCHIKNTSDVIQQLGPTLMALDLSENVVGNLNIDKFKTLHLYSLHLSNANITDFDYGALNLRHLRSLKLSNNHLKEIDFRSTSFTDNSITELNLAGNELESIRNLNRQRFKWLRSLAISQNQMSCERLTQLIREWNGKFSDDPWQQKHGEDCRYLIQSLKSDSNTTIRR